jgi:2-C-methyl-D-erythritol 4-phosphate cytidylyltransferase
MNKFALIVAGGVGTRMNMSVPKQFFEINGKPILMHTFNAFQKEYSLIEFILVLPDSQMDHWKKLCKKFHFTTNHTLVAGGQTRFHSVKNGLAKISGEGIVFIHDGVRPLVSVHTIRSCYEMAVEKGNALPVIPPAESLRAVYKDKNSAADRNRFFLVQTPQTFRVSLIKKAYNQRFNAKFTDDASVLESTGESIHLVEGNRENIKITYPGDFLVAEALLKNAK